MEWACDADSEPQTNDPCRDGDPRTLDLRDNQLNVDDMHVLRMILKNMPDLNIALLGGNQFYKELDDHMFHMNSNLLYLDVSNAGVHEFHKDTGCFFLKCHILGAFGSK